MGKWKTKFLLAYSAKDLSDKAQDAVGLPFGGQAISQALPHQVPPQVTNQMFNTISGYLNNIAAELFQLHMGFSFSFLRANDLRSSLLNIRARSFLLPCA